MRRGAWLLLSAAALGSAAAIAACSSNHDDVPQATLDAGPDVTVDASDAAPPIDAGHEAAALPGNCEPVHGPACDLILQNCAPSDGGAPRECILDPDAALPRAPTCTPVSASEHLGRGHGCCAGARSPQCDPGLECVGDVNADCDGGVATGRCSPHCCGSFIDGGDDYLCGQSDPEGYQGYCNTQIVDPAGNVLYGVCSYARSCLPFGVKPCPSGEACDFFPDGTGNAACDNVYSPEGGIPGEGAPCYALNGCADGLACLGSNTPGTCTMMCILPGSKPPFDAGADAGPFFGGCNPGKSCGTTTTSGFPPWISFCN